MRKRSRGATIGLITLSATLAGCGSAPRAGDSAASAPPRGSNTSRSCPKGDKDLIGLAHQSSAIALVTKGDRLIAYVANPLQKSLEVIDVKARAHLGTIALRGTPEEALVTASGRVLVSLGDRSVVESIAIGADFMPLTDDTSCRIETPSGPQALAESADGKSLVLVSTSGHALTIFDGDNLVKKREVELPRSPKSVIVEDGRAFVSHLARDQVTVVDLDAPTLARAVDVRMVAATAVAQDYVLTRPRSTSQGYALVSVAVPSSPSAGEKPNLQGHAPRHRIVLPMVSVDTGDEVRHSTYYGPPRTEGLSKETPTAVTIDVDAERSEMSHVVSLGTDDFSQECLLPRAAAVRASTSRVYVACRGIDEMIELDGLAVDPMRSVIRRFDLSKGVSALAIADNEGIGVALSEFEDRLDIVSLADGSRTEVDLPSNAHSLSSSYKHGRELFYRTNDTRIAFDGLSCASCHPDGGDDGLTWSTPEGMRQTPMLAGRLHGTEPYGWTRDMGDLPGYVQNTIERLGGSGLGDTDLTALTSYLERMPGPALARTNSEAVRRGRETFEANGCESCHIDATGTDKVRHTFDDKNSLAVDTPTLHFVGLTAPYFHDGRYPSLAELLSDKTSRMGKTASLSPSDREDLEIYLESL